MRGLVAVACLAVGCFDPQFNNPTCGPNGECPSGFECMAGVCRPVDGVDGPPGDECYREASNETDQEINDNNSPEQTGLQISSDGPTRRICGSFVDRAPMANVVDVDAFTLSTIGSPLVGVVGRFTSPGSDDYDAVNFAIQGLVTGAFEDEAELTFGGPPMEIVVGVSANNPTDLDRATDYTIELVPIAMADLCLDSGGAPDYTEQLDTAANNHTENDVAQNMASNPEPTPGDTDAPEPALDAGVLNPGSRMKLVGINALTAVQADSYRDRDTFAIVTGASTSRLQIHLSWDNQPVGADDADLDYYLIREDFGSLSYSNGGGVDGVEYGATDVLPSTTYLLVVATYQESAAEKPYSVMVCADP